jgi:hypothetical protein
MAPRYLPILGLLLASTSVFADPSDEGGKPAEPENPPAQRGDGPPPFPRGGGPEGFGGPGGPGGPGRRGESMPSDEEWETISAFFKAEFPNRWTAFEDRQKMYGQGGGPSEGGKRRLTMRYRMLERLRVDSPTVYDAAMRHAKAEDDVWGAWREYNRTRSEESRTKLRDKVKHLVDDTFRERQARIDSLTAALKSEQDQLTKDRQNPEKLVDEHMDQLEGDIPPGTVGNDIPPPGRRGGWGRGGPGGGPGDGPPR